MMQSIVRQWFLLALAAVLLLGFLLPEPLTPLADSRLLRNTIVATVLFLMSLPLETRSIWHSLRRPWVAVLASGVNMGLLPLIAWGMSHLLRGDLAVGLMITAAAPCTLASAAVWTRRAGGNDTVAIMVTLLTNLTCFFITPLWLLATTGQSVQAEGLDEMISRLAVLVVLPMVAGQLCRQYQPLGRWVTARKAWLGTVAQVGILSMVLIGAVRCARQLAGAAWRERLGPLDFVWLVVVVLALHLVTLAAGMLLARAAGCTRPDRIAVGIAGSQKTLMIGLFVAIRYFGGLTILPMVAYHVGQLVADTLVADWLRHEPTPPAAPDETI